MDEKQRFEIIEKHARICALASQIYAINIKTTPASAMMAAHKMIEHQDDRINKLTGEQNG